jgi:glycosyltransferase involved in cell wall biosynthesis
MKKICVDCRFFGIKDTGIGRYVENLVTHLPTDPSIEVYLLKDCKYHPYSILSQLELPIKLWRIKPDLVHIPHDAPPFLWFGKTILTVHDLTKIHSSGLSSTTLPAWLYHFKYICYRLLLAFSLSKAAHIITPSNFVKQDLVSTFGINPTKISVTYEGVFND